LSLQPALEGGKWAWKENPEARRASWAKAKWAELETQHGTFPRLKLVRQLVDNLKPQLTGLKIM
jgi:hypothetical protein